MLKTIASENPEIVITTLLNDYRVKANPRMNQPCLVKYTRQEIANMTGLRVETVIRTIRNLNEKGRLEIERGKVFLKV